jgi:nucleoid-associated protein YgaU
MGLDALRRAFGPAPSAPGAVPAAAGGVASDRTAPDAAKQYYVIRKGDSLAKIAREKLHDDSLSAVRKLYAANKDKLRDPDDLPVGMKLVIPI